MSNRHNSTKLFLCLIILQTGLFLFDYNILANNIKAKNIKAYDILSNNILANDITANDITAGNISYYGVCIVYNNIKCKSIKGLGKNSFHETLYGRVYVLKNKVKP